MGSLESKDYLSNIREGLELIEFGKKVSRDTRIFIKPNLTYPEYKPGVMTNPEAVAAALQALNDYSAHIMIGDSDSGGYNRFSMDSVYNQTGLREICDKYNAQIVNLSSVPRRAISFEYRKKKFSLDLPSILLDEIDFTITMPVPKVHANTMVSLSFKNQWGCIPENKDRLRLHPYFRHVILEVNKAIHTEFVIMDGKYGLNRNGPMIGDPVELNWVMVADHIGAAARVGCMLMQVPMNSVPHLRYAEQQGMVPPMDQIILNQGIESFTKERFYLRRKWTDLPGLIAFNSPFIAWLGYFSPLAGFLHKLLYLFRKPLYDYDKYSHNRPSKM
ncbi:MAG TPA: DUF362 domain-containing protein [Anaerolineales bacterium]